MRYCSVDQGVMASPQLPHFLLSLTLVAHGHAFLATILAIAGFAAYRSLRSAPAEMIEVGDRAAFGIAERQVDCSIRCASTTDRCFESG